MKLFCPLLMLALTSAPLAPAQTNVPPAKSSSGHPGVYLHNVDLRTALTVYSAATGRSILQSSALRAGGFSITNEAVAGPELSAAFEEMFRRAGIATIYDGEKFVIVVPFSMTNSLHPHSAELASSPAGGNKRTAPGGTINLEGVPLRQALQIYAGFTGRSLVNEQEAPGTQIILQLRTPLTIPEITYAFETVFALNGVRIVPVDETSFKIERILPAPGVKPE
jgi:hypothetical protein